MRTGEARTPDGLRVYAIGDMHGCLGLVRRLFAIIESDIAARPVAQYRIICLGDYCDRGEDSRGVIEYLIDATGRHDVVHLLGNHDQRLLEFPRAAEEMGEAFLYYGGRETLISYGVDPDQSIGLRGLGRAFAAALPSAHRRFLEAAALSHVEGDYFFAHAGVKPGVLLHEQSAGDLLWIRHEFLQYQGDFGKVVVHGHTPWDYVDIQPNRINVDTRAFESGVLSCVVLEENRISILQTAAA